MIRQFSNISLTVYKAEQPRQKKALESLNQGPVKEPEQGSLAHNLGRVLGLMLSLRKSSAERHLTLDL